MRHACNALHWVLVSLALSLSAVSLRAATPESGAVKATELVPGDAVAALSVLDPLALKKAVVESDFGRLWAEPDVQLFAKPIADELLAKYAALRNQMPLAPDLADLEKVLSGELAATFAHSEAEGLPACCLAAQVKDAAALARMLKPILGEQNLVEGKVLAVGPGPLSFVLEKGFLLASSDAAALEKMRARLADPAKRADALAAAKGWLAAQKLLQEPHYALFYASIPKIYAAALRKAPEPEFSRNALAKSGLDAVQAVAAQIGSRGTQLTFDIAAAIDGAPRGFVHTLTNIKPLPAAALKMVPEQATFCTVTCLDCAAMLAAIRAPLDEPKKQEFEAGLAAANAALGLDVERDLFAALGDTYAIYDVGGNEIFGLVPGAALCVSLKDAAKAGQTLDKLIEKLKEELPHGVPFAPTFEVHEVKVGDARTRYLSCSMLPFAPSVAIVQDRLFLTLSVNGMRRALAQLSAPRSLADTAGFKEALERATGKPLDLQALPGQFAYGCPDKFRASYSTLGALAQMVTGSVKMQAQMRAQFGGAQPNPNEDEIMGLLDKADFALFPSDETIVKHMRPAASVFVKLDGGVVLRSDLTVPSVGVFASGQGGIVSSAMIVALAMPSAAHGRVPANETAAAACCKAFAEAEEIYRRTDYDQDGVLEYAQTIRGGVPMAAPEPAELPDPSAAATASFDKLKALLSSNDFGERENASKELEKLGPGIIKLLEAEAKNSKDAEVQSRCKTMAAALKAGLVKTAALDTLHGLYTNKEGEGDLCLVDKAFAMAEGNPSDKRTPKAGYCFKVLTGQGERATGGKRSYLVGKNMTLGYAMIAYPARYGKTGKNCFIINNNGTIFQKDLGPDTAKIVEGMTEFNPDESWNAAE